MNDVIKLAKAMKHLEYHGAEPWNYACKDGYNGRAWSPFTDANDERTVFRYMMERGFSVRQKYWRALRHIINERTDKLTQGGIEAAWPDAIMFLKDGDWARAALKVLNDE